MGKNQQLAEQTHVFLKQSPLYRVLLDCVKALPKESVSLQEKMEGWLGYYVDIPDLNDPAFSRFKTAFFQLQASVLADPPILWEILRNLFPPRRENSTYRT